MAVSLTEASNPHSANLSSMSIMEIIGLMNREDGQVVAAVREALPQIAALAEAVRCSLASGHRLFYVGAGTSGRLGVLDASECPPTFGSSPEEVQAIIAGGAEAMIRAVENAEDNAEAGGCALQERHCTVGDVVIGISASGTTPFVRGALKYAASIGAVTGSVFCNPGTPLEEAQYPVLLAVGPEVLRGSTRLKAGTATKMALNMITTSVMVKLGHCMGNLMVDVAANNAKLIDRQVRILAELTGSELEEAKQMLQDAHGNIRLAVERRQAKLSHEVSD
ncbi:MAG: N-acetylmuramic acid 6-phosphate etherase [bacterium]|nr:N-acetylmuramic acid 6-phosphate etherase [bacterium]